MAKIQAALAAQNRLLRHFVQNPVLSNDSQYQSSSLNFIEFRRASDDSLLNENKRPVRTLVLMHGFGLGLGFFFRNFDTLVNKHFDRVIAIDWKEYYYYH